MTKLVVLGGGTAGTMAANKLRKLFSEDELQITVVDADDAHHYQPGYLFLPFGQLTTSQIVKPRAKQLRKGIDFVQAGIERVDPDDKRVRLADGRTLTYDYLIIATGTHPRPDLTPGMQSEGVHHFYSLEGAENLREAMRYFRGGRLLVHITEMPIKCPVAPLEFIFLADSWLRKQGLREKTELVYVTPLDGAFTKPVASKELGGALDERQIELETDFAVERIDGDRRVIVGFDGRELDYDLLVTVPLNLGAEYIKTSGLGDESNYVECDQKTMQSLAHPDIFVLGDAGTLSTSKAGSVAHFAIDIFVENFQQLMAGKPMTHSFDGHANCFIETGDGQGMLLDFNYATEPLTGSFPFPKVGPFGLLRESRFNHFGKLAFRFIYWLFLLPGRYLPLPSAMSMTGKERAGTAPARKRPSHGPRLTINRYVPKDAYCPLPKDPVEAAASSASARVVDETPSENAPNEAWTRELAEQRARDLGIEPTDRMWGVIDFLRSDFPSRKETATLRRTSVVGGYEIKELFAIFPGKPAKKMSWIAGLPKPKGCV